MLMALRFEPSTFFLKGKMRHLTNFLSYSMFIYGACSFLTHFAFEKEPASFET